MTCVTLTPEQVRKAIEGYEDDLSGENRKYEALYRQYETCHRCGGKRHKEFLSKEHIFGQGTLVPRAVLRCGSCGNLFDPHSNLEVERGNPAQVPPDIPIIGS
jgi:hypothetical protein